MVVAHFIQSDFLKTSLAKLTAFEVEKSQKYGGPQLSQQIQITHIKYKLLTTKTNYWHQIQIAHIKYKLLTSNTNCSHQKQITHIKYKILTSNTNYSHQKQIAHIKYKILTSKTRLNGQRLENENYLQFHSTMIRPPFCSCTWYCRRDVLQQLQKKCRHFCSNCRKDKLTITSDGRQRQR